MKGTRVLRELSLILLSDSLPEHTLLFVARFYFVKRYLYNYSHNYSIMATTIQVSDTTKQLLETYKEEKQASSYDEVIHSLMEKKLNIPKSMFGSAKGLRKGFVRDRKERI